MKTTARLLALIDHEYPDFSKLPEKHQRAIAQMLLHYATPLNRHRVYANAAALTRKATRRMWGRDTTMPHVLGNRYFHVGLGKQDEYSAAIWPQSGMRRALDRFIAEAAEDEQLRLHLATRRRRPRKPIKSMVRTVPSDKSQGGVRAKRSVWADVHIAPQMPVDLVALRKLVTQATGRLQRDALHLLVTAESYARPGDTRAMVPVLYEQKATGRVFEVGHGLQQVRREVRAAALRGLIDYDISNCHFSIFQQWAAQHAWETPAVDRYLLHKKALRSALAASTGATEEQVKAALISLLYGAELRPAATGQFPRRESAIRSLGPAAGKLFCSHSAVVALYEEVRRIGDALVDTLPRHRGLVGNHIGVYVAEPFGRTARAKMLAHGLQGYEAAALKAVARAYGSEIVLLMHDGWVARSPLDVCELQRVIKQATGFQLEVEEEILSPSLGHDNDTCDVCAGLEVLLATLPKINSQGAALGPLSQGKSPAQPIGRGNGASCPSPSSSSFSCVCGRPLSEVGYDLAVRPLLASWNWVPPSSAPQF